MANISIIEAVLDCADDKALADFYAKLLDWKTGEAFGCPLVISPDGKFNFLFVKEDDYVPPVWPEEEGKQQKQMHFDFATDDYPASIDKALALGAVKASLQVMPEHFTVLLDPAGHPFCLCKS